MVVLSIAVLLTASVSILLYYSRMAMKDEAFHDASQTLAGTVLNIDNILLCVEQAIGNIYWNVLQHLNEPERMTMYCRELLESTPYISGVAIAMEPNYYKERGEHFMTYVHRLPSSGTAGEDENEATDTRVIQAETFGNKPYNEQVWYTRTIQQGMPCWIEPIKEGDAEGSTIISFCLPIYDSQGHRVGVMGADVEVSLLSQVVLAAKPSPNSYSILISGDGSYIIHPDSDKLQHMSVFEQMEKENDPKLRMAAQAMMAGKEGFQHFTMNGQGYYVFYKPFERSEVQGRTEGRLDWSVGVVYPENDIVGHFNHLLARTILLAILSLLLLWALTRMLIHRQLLPLRMLTHSAQHIAEGNYTEEIPDSKQNDEIGQLQENFKQMQHSLATNVSELKRLNTSLQEQSRQLQEQYDKAQEADRMKILFLHNMTNQMIEPAGELERSTDELCNRREGMTAQAANQLVDDIEASTKTITSLLNHLLTISGGNQGKEVGS